MLINELNADSGLRLPIIGFGAAPLGGLYGKTEGAKDLVKLALEKGVNYFDTSPYYGNSEIVLGECLRRVPRGEYYISTKCGRNNDDTFDYSGDNIRRSVATSLDRLHTHYIDICLLHDIEFGNLEEVMSEGIDTLLGLREQGTVNHIGFSTYSLDTVLEASKYPTFKYLDAILVYGHNNLFASTLKSIKPILDDHNIGLIDASPLALGLLTVKGPPDWHPANAKQRELCKKLAKKLEDDGSYSLPYLALYYTLTNMIGCSLLIGVDSCGQLIDNLDVLCAATRGTDGDEIDELIRVVKRNLEPLRGLNIS